MSNRALAVLAVLICTVAAVFWSNLKQGGIGMMAEPPVVHARPLLTETPTTPETVATPVATLADVTLPTVSQGSETIGTAILRDYADPRQPAEHDLTLMAELIDNFTLLVKTAADRPLGANEDWAKAFRGMNPAQERFLPETSRAFNVKHQLVDRWGTPLFFHAAGRGQYQIRSAGPDHKLWTEDDIQRNPDGSFAYGPSLSGQ
jgi:hypothetical protein